MLKTGDCGMTTGRHLFIADSIRSREFGKTQRQAFKDGARNWKAASPKAKAEARLAACGRNARARALKHDTLRALQEGADDGHPSPWNISKGSSMPLHRDDVEALLAQPRGIRDHAQAWEESNKSIIHASADFPDAVEYRRLIPPNVAMLGANEKDRFNVIISNLRLLFGYMGFKQDYTRPLCIAAGPDGQRLIAIPCCILKTPHFSGQFAMYAVEGSSRGSQGWAAAKRDCPYLATLAFGQTLPLPALATEVLKLGNEPLAYRFLRTSVPKNTTHLPGTVEVTTEDDILDFTEVKKQHAAKAESLRALRLLKKTLGQTPLRARQPQRKIVP